MEDRLLLDLVHAADAHLAVGPGDQDAADVLPGPAAAHLPALDRAPVGTEVALDPLALAVPPPGLVVLHGP